MTWIFFLSNWRLIWICIRWILEWIYFDSTDIGLLYFEWRSTKWLFELTTNWLNLCKIQFGFECFVLNSSIDGFFNVVSSNEILFDRIYILLVLFISQFHSALNARDILFWSFTKNSSHSDIECYVQFNELFIATLPVSMPHQFRLLWLWIFSECYFILYFVYFLETPKTLKWIEYSEEFLPSIQASKICIIGIN